MTQGTPAGGAKPGAAGAPALPRIRDTYLLYGAPDIRQAEIDEVVATMRSGWLGTGPRAARFEEAMRAYVGAKHAVAVNSCTAALHLSMVASGVGPGDEVITTPMTFCATANSIVHTGATPVFADIRRDTHTIDPALVEKAITPRTRALLPVHFGGRAADMDPLLALAKKHGLLMVEDAAHAIETTYRGRKVGTIGEMTCFSFYVTKNVTTAEGGMITTADEEKANRIRMYALHGMSKDAWRRYSDEGFKHYSVVFPGFKYNMTDLQAAIGLHQLARVEEGLVRRAEIWRRYDEALRDLPLHLPPGEEAGSVHGRHLYSVLIDVDRAGVSRDEVQDRLHRMNIGTGIHYRAVHLHDYYRERFGFRRGDFPESEFVSDRTLTLPLSPVLTDQDVEDVIRALRAALGAA
jgi:dTDP-4-amino-4,6-dideoxygalactose transaminase